MSNRDGALAIGQHVQQLMELLESDESMTATFLDGDGSFIITRQGITFVGFDPDHKAVFVATPMNPDAEVVRFRAMLVQWTMDVSCEGMVESSARMADWCCYWWGSVRIGCRTRQRGRRRIGDAPSDFDDPSLPVELDEPGVACFAGNDNYVFDAAAPTDDNHDWVPLFDHAAFDDTCHHHDIARSWR